MASQNLSEQLQRMIERAKNLRDGDWEKFVATIEDFERPETPEPNTYSDVKMTLTSQYCREVGSRLYNTNPTVRVQPEEWADKKAKMRAPVEENLLNLAMDRTDFFHSFRDAIKDSFTAFGVLWHGLDRVDDRLPSVEWVRWSDIWFDPDVHRHQDSAYLIRRCRHSKAYMVKKYATDENGKVDNEKAKKIMQANLGNSTEEENKDRDGKEFTNTSVVYYKIYTKIGLQAFDESREKAPDKDTYDDAKMYVVLDDSFDVIYDGEWETPYHIAGDYPCTILSYYSSREMVYPDPPLKDGVPWMVSINKAMNNLQTQYRFNSQKFVVMLRGAGVDIESPDLDKLRGSADGSPVQFLTYDLKSTLGPQALRNADIRRYMHTLDLGDDRYGLQLEHIRQLTEQWYKAVGMNEYMYAGAADKQDRSAKATESREKNALSRINDMGSCIDAFASAVLRKMLFTARVHDTEDDIAALMGPQAGKLWGSTLAGEETTSSYWEDYYSQNADDVPDGSSPEEMASQTLEGGVDILQWLDSTNIKIELGSTQRKSPEEEEASIAQANNQLVPSLNNMGMPLAASMFVAKRAELLNMDAGQVATIVQSGATSQQLIDAQKNLQIKQLQAQIQQLQAQQQQSEQGARQQAEATAMQQAENENRMQIEDSFRERELSIKETEAEAAALQALRPADRSQP